MFGLMRSSRHRLPEKPCPCNYVCLCHKPYNGDGLLWIIVGFALLIGGLLVLSIVFHTPNPVRHIEVNGQDCTIDYISDGCTSTGACHGHDVAICPK